MDIDGGNTGQGPQQQSATVANSSDIEQSFLQQFSCLGTTDHDELVSQLQRIAGNQLNYSTAKFFLDMNNWNITAAVGCYFDFTSGQKLPSMRFIADETIGEGESITPNTKYVQSWRVQNSGDETWPNGCILKCTSNANEPTIPIEVQLRPGEQTVLSIPICSPCDLGSFQTKWRLCTSYGTYFGDHLWSIVQVQEGGTLALTQQLAELRTVQTQEFQQPQMEDNEMC